MEKTKFARDVDLEALADKLYRKIIEVEASSGEKNVIAAVSDEFGLDAARSLTIAAVAMGKITGLTDALAGKADMNHVHTTNDIDGLESALADKAEKTHTHTAASYTEPGFMSANDKTKLDGIEAMTDADRQNMLTEIFSS